MNYKFGLAVIAAWGITYGAIEPSIFPRAKVWARKVWEKTRLTCSQEEYLKGINAKLLSDREERISELAKKANAQ